MTTIDAVNNSVLTIDTVKAKPGKSTQVDMEKIVQRALDFQEPATEKLTFCCKFCNNHCRFECEKFSSRKLRELFYQLLS